MVRSPRQGVQNYITVGYAIGLITYVNNYYLKPLFYLSQKSVGVESTVEGPRTAGDLDILILLL